MSDIVKNVILETDMMNNTLRSACYWTNNLKRVPYEEFS
jgi:hypothetical protein